MVRWNLQKVPPEKQPSFRESKERKPKLPIIAIKNERVDISLNPYLTRLYVNSRPWGEKIETEGPRQ
jgi:hypothetical protein